MKIAQLVLGFALCCALASTAQQSGDPFSYTLKERSYRNPTLGFSWKAPEATAEAGIYPGDHSAMQRLRDQNRKDGILLRSGNQTFFANPNQIGCCGSRSDSLSHNGNPGGASYYEPGEFRVTTAPRENGAALCDLLATRLAAAQALPEVHTQVLAPSAEENIGGQTFCRADWSEKGKREYPTIYVRSYITVRQDRVLAWEFRADAKRALNSVAKSMKALQFDHGAE